MPINHKQLFFGVASFLGVKGRNRLTTGGTNTAEYCYSVWLRHLVLGFRYHLCAQVPEVVAEFGPGDSIGIGLAALICGSQRYIGLDVVRHSTPAKNLAIFDQLVELYQKRAVIPHGPKLDRVKPGLTSYDFPSAILTDAHLAKALSEERLKRIRQDILRINHQGSSIQYLVPWIKTENLSQGSVDMIYSQAVMEYCEMYPQAYCKMFQWLKPSGFISHQIDFKCHGTYSSWDGHWSCSDFLWSLMRGKRPYFITRATHSDHTKAMMDAGFVIVKDHTVNLSPTISAHQLNPRFKSADPFDRTIAGAFIQAKRMCSLLFTFVWPVWQGLCEFAFVV